MILKVQCKKCDGDLTVESRGNVILITPCSNGCYGKTLVLKTERNEIHIGENV